MCRSLSSYTADWNGTQAVPLASPIYGGGGRAKRGRRGYCRFPLSAAVWDGVLDVPLHRQKEKLLLSQELVLALPIFTARHQATIVGVSELNFCVRDGNRWTLTTINTNSHREAVNLPLYKALSCLFNAPHILHFSFFMCLHASFVW